MHKVPFFSDWKWLLRRQGCQVIWHRQRVMRASFRRWLEYFFGSFCRPYVGQFKCCCFCWLKTHYQSLICCRVSSYTIENSSRKNTWALVLFSSFAPHSTEAQIQGQILSVSEECSLIATIKQIIFTLKLSFMVTGTDCVRLFFKKKKNNNYWSGSTNSLGKHRKTNRQTQIQTTDEMGIFHFRENWKRAFQRDRLALIDNNDNYSEALLLFNILSITIINVDVYKNLQQIQ